MAAAQQLAQQTANKWRRFCEAHHLSQDTIDDGYAAIRQAPNFWSEYPASHLLEHLSTNAPEWSTYVPE